MNANDPAGLAAAREYARWYLGSSWWADQILDAYCNPDWAAKRVAHEKARLTTEGGVS